MNTTASSQAFGALLRQLRLRAGRTQREFGHLVGYSAAQINRLEKGVRIPNADVVAARFMSALEIQADSEVASDLLRLAGVRPLSEPKYESTDPLLQRLESPSSLPVRLTSFIDRRHDLTQIRCILEAHRHITLIGTAGVGKTSLAIEAARSYLARNKAEIRLVELAKLSEPAAVPGAVACALGIAERSRGAELDALERALRDRQMLMLLDNCEHVIEGCARTATQLLQSCPGLTLLATSREPLHVPGEVIYMVPPLLLPAAKDRESKERLCHSPAVRLFLDRAASYHNSFAEKELSDRALAALVDICIRLDGIPLAIELAAACVNIMTLEDIARRLDDQLDLPPNGSRAHPARQQSLHAAIEWSYSLLSAPERLLFERIAAFPTAFSLQTAEMTFAGDSAQNGTALAKADVFRHLARLVDASLVHVVAPAADGSTRYSMHGVIRHFVLRKLASASVTD